MQFFDSSLYSCLPFPTASSIMQFLQSLKVACASCLPGRRINLISLQGLVAYANPLVLALGCFSSSSSTLPQKLRLSRPCSRALQEAGLHRKMCLLFPKMSFSKWGWDLSWGIARGVPMCWCCCISTEPCQDWKPQSGFCAQRSGMQSGWHWRKDFWVVSLGCYHRPGQSVVLLPR